MDRAFRTVRIVHVAMLVAAVVYAILPEIVHVGTRSVNSTVLFTLFAVSFSLVIIAFIFRKRMVDRAALQLVTSPTDATAMGRWRAGNIALFGMSEAVVLYGLVLRFMGANVLQAGILYASGIALLLFFTPRRPG